MPDPSLRDVQHWMQARILPATAAQAAAEPAIALQPQRGTPGLVRMEVYADGYVARLREALAEVFEAVQHVLGEHRFTHLAETYAAAHPSQDYNLSLAGRHLPVFLQTSPLLSAWPFLADLSLLEWLVSAAFHVPQQPALLPARLTALTVEQWDKTRLSFQPGAACVSSAWPIFDIWHARQTPRAEVSIDVVGRPQRVFIFRRELTVRVERLEEAEAQVLTGLLAGQTLGAVCERLAHAEGAAMPPLGAWFARWMAAGLITDVVLP